MDSPRVLAAYLLFFPLAVILMRRYPRAKGVGAAVLVGTLFLPQGVLLWVPGLPIIDKERVTYLAVLLGILIAHRRDFLSAKPGLGLELLLLILIFVASIGTLLMNQNPIVNEEAIQPALSIRWLFGQTLSELLTLALPYVIGRTMVKSIDDLRVLVRTFVAGGILYAVVIVIEVVMALPFHVFQFSHYIYGVSIRTQDRWGLTQPVAFMQNGLALATFMAMALVMAAGLRRIGESAVLRLKGFQAPLFVGLLGTLNVAGNSYGFSMFLAVRLLTPRIVVFVGVVIAAFAFVYPALRMFDLFPNEQLVSFAAQYDADRARSLNGRFVEEEFVLGTIGERFWFGWGPFSRIPGARWFGWDDGEPGLDAWWVINTGMSGIVGTLLAYLFMLIPVVTSWRRSRRLVSTEELVLVGAVMICIAIRMIDLLINGWWNCLPVLCAGALMGATTHTTAVKRSSRRPRADGRSKQAIERASIPRRLSLC